MIPMMDFSVVVLPAPLRPSSVTTSPPKTSNVTPCSTWDSPYQACRSLTASSGMRVPSSMACPQVGFPHPRIGRHGRVVALREHASARQHCDVVGQASNHAEVVLDHQHCALGRDRFDERADAFD